MRERFDDRDYDNFLASKYGKWLRAKCDGPYQSSYEIPEPLRLELEAELRALRLRSHQIFDLDTMTPIAQESPATGQSSLFLPR
jgi:hypothetical protein